MPKKSRRSRLKSKRRGNLHQPPAAREAAQPAPVSPPSTKPVSAARPQAVAAKSQVMVVEQAARHQYVLSDVRRSLVTAAIIFVLLVALYFSLR